MSYGGNKHGLNYNPGERREREREREEEGKKKGNKKAQRWFALSASGGIFPRATAASLWA